METIRVKRVGNPFVSSLLLKNLVEGLNIGIYIAMNIIYHMAILRAGEIRKLEDKEVGKRLNELRLELAKERGNINIGGTVTSPGRIKEIRKTVARILTIRGEKERSISASKIKAASSPKTLEKVIKGGTK